MTGLPDLDLFQDRPSERIVSRHGRPAACLDLHGGMPAYESEHGKLLVMETLAVFYPPRAAAAASPMALPVGYRMCALRGQSDLVALHDDPDAVWSWRPCLYHLKVTITERAGSQQEVAYRYGIHQAALAASEEEDEHTQWIIEQAQAVYRRYGGTVPYNHLPKNARKRMRRAYVAWAEARTPPPLALEAANERADRLLREHLNPQQLLDLEATGSFYVRGTINRLYRIRLGNGCEAVKPDTREPVVSFCIHPDEWIPDADVALSLKLMIESGKDGEAELLAGAKATPIPARRSPARAEREAARMERDLLPAPHLS